MLKMLKQMFERRPAPSIAELLASGAVVVDVRSRGEYATGHFPKSLNVPLAQLQKNGVDLPKDKTIITCCASGMRSATAKRWLNDNGFPNVFNAGSWQTLK